MLRSASRRLYDRLLHRARQPRPVRQRSLPRARVVVLEGAHAERVISRSVDGLRNEQPQFSASVTATGRQRRALVAVAVLLALGLVLDARVTAIVLVGLATYLYAAILVYRVVLFRRSLRSSVLHTVTDEQARAVPDEALPVYTVLIPAYREPEVIARLVRDITALEYPPSRLDVKLLIEHDDLDTLDAVHHADPPQHITVVVVPESEPRTKPKAVNVGLCLAEGSLVTIYDAEDRPEPLQLRRAAVAFARADTELVCLQASLAYYNADQNIITRWFEAEYLSWFRFFLPGLSSSNAPIPLGGTSNHLRREALERAGGWDPFNVTEDADLGIRLARMGYRCGVLDSVTLEEATSDFVNWARQRSRWQKGYLQTWLVHLRHPRQLRRELGWTGFLHVNLFIGGTPLLALLNPVFWALTLLWFVTTSERITAVFPGPVYYPALLCWAVGNLLIAYLSLLSVQLARRPSLAVAALLSPLYWVMMSVAAYKAFWQLFRNPSHWEKTTHGLHEDDPETPSPERVRVAV